MNNLKNQKKTINEKMTYNLIGEKINSIKAP